MKKGIIIVCQLFMVLNVFAGGTNNYLFNYTTIFTAAAPASQSIEQIIQPDQLFTFGLQNLPTGVVLSSCTQRTEVSPVNAIVPLTAFASIAAPPTVLYTITCTPDTCSWFEFVITLSNGNALTLKFTTGRPSPNFFVGSFIKSIAGVKINSEMLDILFKVNFNKKSINGSHLTFAMIGADAGLSSNDTGNAAPLRLNEAMIHVNWTIIPIESSTKRVAFIGGGLKVFNTNAYLGGHIGITEIRGIFQTSYISVGYYYSPWLTSVKADSTPYNYYRNNVYIESALNAFGDNVPKVMQCIRLKFGLMLPFAFHKRDAAGKIIEGDAITPTSKDFMYRLAVEVPIGGPIKF